MIELFFSQPEWLQMVELWAVFAVAIILQAVVFIIQTFRER